MADDGNNASKNPRDGKTPSERARLWWQFAIAKVIIQKQKQKIASVKFTFKTAAGDSDEDFESDCSSSSAEV